MGDSYSLSRNWPLALGAVLALAFTAVGVVHQPGPDVIWVCETRPCGAMTLFGPSIAVGLATIITVAVWSKTGGNDDE